MFTAIIEFATLSMAALYVADAIVGIHDAHVRRTSVSGVPVTKAPEPEVPATPEPEVPATPEPKPRKPRAPKAPKPKAPKPETPATPGPKPKASTVAELRAQAKARGLKGYSKLSKADLLALLAQ